MKTKMDAKRPSSDFPSFVYRQDGFELSYLIWVYYTRRERCCQEAAFLNKNFTNLFNENLYNGEKIRYTEPE